MKTKETYTEFVGKRPLEKPSWKWRDIVTIGTEMCFMDFIDCRVM
jgi:hypothetical protein